MSKRTLVSRRKREERIMRKFFFMPQRMILGGSVDVTELPPMSDRLWASPEPEPTTGPYGLPLTEDVFRRHINPYGRSSDL